MLHMIEPNKEKDREKKKAIIILIPIPPKIVPRISDFNDTKSLSQS